MKRFFALALLMLAGCGAPTANLVLSHTETSIRSQATQGREAAYQAVRNHFSAYGRIFSMQFGSQGPVWNFAVTVGPDATDMVKCIGTYDENTGKVQIDQTQEVGGPHPF